MADRVAEPDCRRRVVLYDCSVNLLDLDRDRSGLAYDAQMLIRVVPDFLDRGDNIEALQVADDTGDLNVTWSADDDDVVSCRLQLLRRSVHFGHKRTSRVEQPFVRDLESLPIGIASPVGRDDHERPVRDLTEITLVGDLEAAAAQLDQDGLIVNQLTQDRGACGIGDLCDPLQGRCGPQSTCPKLQRQEPACRRLL